MAFFKSITPRSSSTGSAAAISSYLSDPRGGGSSLGGVAEYLERGRPGRESDRLVSHAHSDTILTDDPREWVGEMLATKVEWNKTGGVPYYHFVISPDPGDRVAPGELVELGREFMDRRFPGSQWFMAIHDDNANHITHAHIVLNSVYPDTGRKVHRSNADLAGEANCVQDLCREHSLSPLPYMARDGAGGCRVVMAEGREAEPRARARGARQQRVERAMRERGARSWVADIRDAVDAAARASETWDQFLARLDLRGVRVERRRRGVTFVMDGWEGRGPRRVRDVTLGEEYAEDAIRRRLLCDFDSVTGEVGRSLWHPHMHMRVDVTVTASVRAIIRARGSDPAWLGNVGRDEPWRPSYAGSLDSPTSLMRALTSLDALTDAVATVREEGAGSASDLARKAAEARSEASGLRERAARASRAADRARDLRGRALEASGARHELEGLRAQGRLDRRSRARLMELEDSVPEMEAEVERELSRASGIVSRAGLEGADQYGRAGAVAAATAAARERADRAFEAARRRSARLSRAEATVNGAMPPCRTFEQAVHARASVGVRAARGAGAGRPWETCEGAPRPADRTGEQWRAMGEEIEGQTRAWQKRKAKAGTAPSAPVPDGVARSGGPSMERATTRTWEVSHDSGRTATGPRRA